MLNPAIIIGIESNIPMVKKLAIYPTCTSGSRVNSTEYLNIPYNKRKAPEINPGDLSL